MDTKLKKISITAALAALIFAIGSASADDTDVYMNPGAGLPEDSEPMVMFSLDYRPNLGSTACTSGECDTLIREGYISAEGPYTFFDVLRGALRKVFDPLEGVKVGLMLNHDHINECAGFGRTNCSNGGYIAMGFETFEEGDGNGAKKRFLEILDAMPIPLGGQSHSYQGKELFFEFFRYLTGQGVYNAHNGYTDFFTSNTENLDADHPLIAWDPDIETGAKTRPAYISPFETAGECSSLYTVNAIGDPITAGGFGLPQREFPNVIQYLNDVDLANGEYGLVPNLEDKQNVTSYFIVDERMINTTTIGYARAGGTGSPLALSDNPDDLVATLQEVFRQILSVSTTFVAASVPVNVFNRAEITDNVYIALFQLDAQARPYWVGNVKKLRLEGANSASSDAFLVDALNTPAVAADGRIRFDALTHWTVPSALPPADTDAGEVDGRDGRVVSRGGAGQRIPGVIAGDPQEANGLGGRTIYYDRTSSSLAAFNVDLLTAAALQPEFDVPTTTEAAALIAFSRGLDVDDLDGDRDTSEAREWIFGDALHSRPLPINYGSIAGYSDPDNPAIFIAVASNDGMLRMIRNMTGSGQESGEEVWAFMPRASMKAQKVLRANGSGMKHPYTLDGAPVAFIMDKDQDGSINAGDGDRVYLYVGMRRGGKNYYAFDVTNPERPELMWTISKGDPGFEELALTFSTPRVGLVPTALGPRPALMFAGGYDVNKDTRGSVGSDDSEGNAIYVVDAEYGSLIWKARGNDGGASSTVFEHPDMVDSIPSTLTVGDTNGDGLTDRIVVGDTGGNIWRADLAGDDTSKWRVTKLASVGRHATSSPTIADDRRFFHRPDLVPSKDKYGLFDGVVIGSGNRADPLDLGGTTENFLYMIKDRRTAVASATDTGVTHDEFGDVTDNCLQTDGGCSVDLTYGWRLEMEDPGEKVLATPLTITGKTFFTTYLPNSGTGATACAPTEGAGRQYAVGFQSIELQSLGIPAEVVSVPPNKILRPDLQIDNVNATTRWRTFWHMQEDADIAPPSGGTTTGGTTSDPLDGTTVPIDTPQY